MVNHRKKLLSRLQLSAPTENEKILAQLAIERICVDMCDFYENFYEGAGPGAMVYVPSADKNEDSMFYLTVSNMISALDEFKGKDMEGPAEVMQKAITRAEAIDPKRQGLFIVQDDEHMSLIVYNRENPIGGITS